jgi:serine protease Do
MKKIKDANYSTNDDKDKNPNVEEEFEKRKEMKIENNFKSEDKEESETIKSTSTFKQEKPNKKDKNNFWQKHRSALIAVIITFAICLGIFGLFYNYYLKNLIVEKTKLEKSVTVTDTGIADAVEKVYDSVVTIETYVNNREYASGTGFVFKTEGDKAYILTNSHVISNSNSVKVTFTNNNQVTADVVGSDDYSDIAVLSVNKDDILLVAETGSSEDMRVGDTTFAVGAPIDSSVYSWSVTRGILSGKDRLVEVTSSDNKSTYVMEVLQTDTAINSGNSGGPLCNSNGQVIGITNMKLASSQIEGMGFAIPIEEALKYAESIISGKQISRPYLGITIYDATSYYSNTSGVYIEYVEENSAADKAGLQRGDKILEVNGVEVSNSSYFKHQLYKYDVGDQVTIKVERNGKEKEIKVTLGSNNIAS